MCITFYPRLSHIPMTSITNKLIEKVIQKSIMHYSMYNIKFKTQLFDIQYRKSKQRKSMKRF